MRGTKDGARTRVTCGLTRESKRFARAPERPSHQGARGCCATARAGPYLLKSIETTLHGAIATHRNRPSGAGFCTLDDRQQRSHDVQEIAVRTRPRECRDQRTRGALCSTRTAARATANRDHESGHRSIKMSSYDQRRLSSPCNQRDRRDYSNCVPSRGPIAGWVRDLLPPPD